jgi:hypothetical protein
MSLKSRELILPRLLTFGYATLEGSSGVCSVVVMKVLVVVGAAVVYEGGAMYN